MVKLSVFHLSLASGSQIVHSCVCPEVSRDIALQSRTFHGMMKSRIFGEAFRIREAET